MVKKKRGYIGHKSEDDRRNIKLSKLGPQLTKPIFYNLKLFIYVYNIIWCTCKIVLYTVIIVCHIYIYKFCSLLGNNNIFLSDNFP